MKWLIVALLLAASAAPALDTDQCGYFGATGRVAICHAAGGQRVPLRIATAACIEAHAQHADDRIAPDGDCGPDACLPSDAPCDDTLGCCGPFSCGGGGVPGVCGCRPFTCASLGRVCGAADDGCGGVLDCGSCGSGQACNGAGQCAGACDFTTNASCGVTSCCQSDHLHESVCCGKISMLVTRTCTGAGTCVGGGTYPNCATAVHCPDGSWPLANPTGTVGCANPCGPVGPGGCAVCSAATYSTSCSAALAGDFCAASSQ
jgi:hypothetical protein